MERSEDRIRTRSGEGGLVPIATVLLALVALGARSCAEPPAIALYPVELVDPAPDDPFERDPLFAPTPLECAACRERTVQLVGGDRVTIRSAPDPGLVLRQQDVDFLELSDHEAPVESEAAPPERFAVYAVLEAAAREAWTPFAVEQSRRFILVELEGRPVDLIRPLGWSRGLRIGVFETADQREAYLQTLPFTTPRARKSSTPDSSE